MLTVHLWKEWREQRLQLAAIVAALVALALVAGLAAPVRLVPADSEVWFLTLAVAAGFVGFAGDLVPGEERRGQLGLLLRTPAALRTAFVAKTAVLLLGLAVLALCGWAAGELCVALSGGRDFAGRGTTLGHAPAAMAGIAAGVAIAAPWAFAVSCWLARGASVVPVTALALAVVVAPPVLVVASYGAPVGPTEVVAGAVLLFAGGLVAAWASFVRGLRCGRRFATARNGLVAAAVFVGPSLFWCGERVWTWHHVDPADADVRLGDALLGGDGRTAFVSLHRDWNHRRSGPGYAVALDLDTGTWRQLGGAQAWLFGVGILTRCEFTTGLSAPQPWVVRWQLDGSGEEVLGAALLDGVTGELVRDCPDRRFPSDMRAELAAAARRTTPFRLPDGGRAWFDGRTTVCEDAHGTREVFPWPDGVRPGLAVGFGFHWLYEAGGRSEQVFDLGRRRTVRLPDGLGWLPFVRQGAWVARGRRDGWEVFDPDSGDRRPWPFADVEPTALAGDGRLVVGGPGRTVLLDPDSGAWTALTCTAAGAVAAVSVADWRTFLAPSRTPSGATVLRVHLDAAGGSRRTFARLDGDRLTACVADDAEVSLVAIPDDEHVLVVRDRRTLERWRFGSDEVQVLFAVGAARR